MSVVFGQVAYLNNRHCLTLLSLLVFLARLAPLQQTYDSRDSRAYGGDDYKRLFQFVVLLVVDCAAILTAPNELNVNFREDFCPACVIG
jgi:hypothetical protein